MNSVIKRVYVSPFSLDLTTGPPYVEKTVMDVELFMLHDKDRITISDFEGNLEWRVTVKELRAFARAHGTDVTPKRDPVRVKSAKKARAK